MIKINDVSFSYIPASSEGDQKPAGENSLQHINLEVASGEFVVLCGRSGCGKTTLTRLINGLIPHFYEGQLTGEVTIAGRNVADQSLAKLSKQVGSVFQNPRSQFFNVDTTSELAFGCENQALPVAQIKQRVEEVTEIFDLQRLLGRSIFALSGGEKQRIACASVYAAWPDVFVLDEPSSNLDAASILQLKEVLKKLKDAGKTIIISEHRLYYLTDLADRFLYMEQGRIAARYHAAEIKAMPPEQLSLRGLRAADLQRVDISPVQVPGAEAEDTCFKLKDILCRRGKQVVLDVPKLQLPQGEIVAVIGENGAGKSTFAECFCGILRHKGEITFGHDRLKGKTRLAKSYMVMQDVNHQLFCESVAEELSLNIPEKHKSAVPEVMREMGIDDLADIHPLALSGGQKQRVAIASAICSRSELLIYDEPTSGLDFASMQSTCKMVRMAAKQALLSLVITHDLEFILSCCTAVLQIENGRVKEYYSLEETDGINKVKSYFI